MSKRKPTSDLNDRNWDEEEEPEEAGTFRLADQDVLKNRTIRKAKRTVHTESSSSGSLFAGFALKTSDSWVPKPALSSGITGAFSKNFGLESKSNGTPKAAVTNSANNGRSSENPEYLRQLKVLNENILSWIQKHVSDNPYCILTPSFRDYEKHLSDLEKKYNVESSAEKKPANDGADSASSKSSTPAQFAGGFTFGQSVAAKSSDANKEKSADSKGSGLTGTTGFSFGSGLTTGGFGSSNLSQGTGGLFSFAATQPKVDTPAAPQTSGEDDEYVPPQVEVREIKEDGAVYTIRCKLFNQKDGQWADRGVGNLHLKPTGDGRTQLIIRADTNLGNILLNILLSAAIPTKRQGKNNVFLVCVPNPPIDTKNPSSDPIPMLIRVKTAEDADALLAKLEELKTSA